MLANMSLFFYEDHVTITQKKDVAVVDWALAQYVLISQLTGEFIQESYQAFLFLCGYFSYMQLLLSHLSCSSTP